MSPVLPARCMKCGHQWQPRGGIEVVNSTNVTLNHGFLVGACPRPGCGGTGQLLSGTFDVVDEGIRMLSGPQWSWDLVETLRLGLREILETQPTDPLAEVEDLAPSFGERLRRITQGWTREQVLALIAAIFTILQWAEVSPGDIAGWLKDVPGQINDLLDDVTKNGPPEGPPEAPVRPAGPSSA